MKDRDWKEKLDHLWAASFQGLHLALAEELAIDLGTAHTRIYLAGTGMVLDEPSVIAFDTETGRVEAVGREAKALSGREPQGIRVVHPIKNGVIADCEAAGLMLAQFINCALKQRRLFHPRLLICVPSDLTELEQKAFEDVASRAGAGRIKFTAAPLAAAAGADLDVRAARTSMIVDIGAGTVEIAVLSRSGLVYASTHRVGGVKMDQAIVQYLRQERRVEIGPEAAERMKIELGSVNSRSGGHILGIGGRSLTTRLPELISVTSEEVRTAIEPVLKEIQRSLRAAFEELSPEASVDLLDSGITLSGGLAQLAGLPERLGQEMGLPMRLASEPRLAAVLGAGRLLEQDTPTPPAGKQENFRPDGD